MDSSAMMAVRIHAYGGPEVLVYEEAPRPKPALGEVLIRVHAAAVNPLDWKVREGYAREWLKHTLPLIPGWDVSGVVEALGPGASGFSVGEAVYGVLDTRRNGAYAEYAVAPLANLARKPRSVDHVHAASVPVAALAAWQGLFEAGGLARGQRVLVHGAAGSVGGFAVQLASIKGASVVAAAKGPAAGSLAALGADDVVDYDARPFEESAGEVDLVLDVIGGEIQERSLKVLRRGGTLVSTVAIGVAEQAAAAGVRAASFRVRPDGAQLEEIAQLIDAGRVKLVVGTVLPLARAREAHEQAQSGRGWGKIVLKVSA